MSENVQRRLGFLREMCRIILSQTFRYISPSISFSPFSSSFLRGREEEAEEEREEEREEEGAEERVRVEGGER